MTGLAAAGPPVDPKFLVVEHYSDEYEPPDGPDPDLRALPTLLIGGAVLAGLAIIGGLAYVLARR